MRFFDYFRVAFKNLWRQKARTILTILAVVIGSISVLVMLSLVIGARNTLTTHIEKIGGLTLITVSPNADASSNGSLFSSDNGPGTDGKKLDDKALETLEKLPHVVDGTAVAGIIAKSMRLQDGKKSTYPQVIGYDPRSAVFQVDLVAGRNLQPGDLDKIVISTSALDRLGYSGDPKGAVGKQLVFKTEGGLYNDWLPDPPKPPADASPDWWKEQNSQPQEFTADIVGVAASGIVGEQNLITLDWARKLMTVKQWQDDPKAESAREQQCQAQAQKNQNGFSQPPNCKSSPIYVLSKSDMLTEQGYSMIMLKADSTANVEGIAEQVIKSGYGANTAKDILDQITQIFTAVGIVLGGIGGISLFVAAIGIINTMVMAIYERTREIGVLRACGATRATIRRLFSFEATLLGFWGGVIGFLIALGLAQVANWAVAKYASSNLPLADIMHFPYWLVGGVIIFTTLIGLLAGWYPSVRAARLDPVEALRYE